jgi:hypothetical protein
VGYIGKQPARVYRAQPAPVTSSKEVKVNLSLLALGLIIGYVLHKHLSGQADIEAEAYVAGYAQGYSDRQMNKTQKYEIWDSARWREHE